MRTSEFPMLCAALGVALRCLLAFDFVSSLTVKNEREMRETLREHERGFTRVIWDMSLLYLGYGLTILIQCSMNVLCTIAVHSLYKRPGSYLYAHPTNL